MLWESEASRRVRRLGTGHMRPVRQGRMRPCSGPCTHGPAGWRMRHPEQHRLPGAARI